MLIVQEYLRSGKTLKNLSQTYNIQCNVCNDLNLVALNYSNLSPMNDKMVQECKGLFLELDNWEVACKSFNAFFRNIEPNGYRTEALIDWSSARLYEKLDGALICIYFYKGKWRIGMRMSADGSFKVTAINGVETPLTFAELTLKTIEESGYSWEEYTSYLNKNIYYSFELISPETRVGVLYSDRQLVFIGAVDKNTLKELDIYDFVFPIEKPKFFKVKNLDEVLKINNNNKDPLKSEGFILTDGNFNRIKYINPEYIKLMNYDTNDELEALRELLMYISTFSTGGQGGYYYYGDEGPGSLSFADVTMAESFQGSGPDSFYYETEIGENYIDGPASGIWKKYEYTEDPSKFYWVWIKN